MYMEMINSTHYRAEFFCGLKCIEAPMLFAFIVGVLLLTIGFYKAFMERD